MLLLGRHIPLQLLDRVGRGSLIRAIDGPGAVGEDRHEVDHGQQAHDPEDDFHSVIPTLF